MPTWIAAVRRVPYRFWNSRRPARQFSAHAYKARNGVHRLPEAMLINSTTLWLGWLRVRQFFGASGPLLVLSNSCKWPANLNGGHPVFLSKSGQNFCGAADTETKTWLHWPQLQFVHPLQPEILKMHKSCNKGALAQLPQRWFCAMMFGALWSYKDWSAGWAESAVHKGVSTELQKSIFPSTWFQRSKTVLGMSVRNLTSLGSDLASVTDLKRYQTPHGLCCDFWGKPLQLVGEAAEFKFESKFEPLPVIWQSLWRLFHKVIEGLECKIKGLALGAALQQGRTGEHKLRAFPSRLQSLRASIGSLEENMLPLLRYWLSSGVNKVLLLCKFLAATSYLFFSHENFDGIGEKLLQTKAAPIALLNLSISH